MNLSDLRTLLDYHYWARDRVLDAAAALTPEQYTRDLGSSFRSVRDTLAHLYGAEYAWYQRWNGTSPTALPSADLFPDVDAVRGAWRSHETKMRAFVEALGDAGIDRVFEFTLLNGRPASAIFWQNLQHVVNHGSYHRGQVTTLLRQLGASPPKSMDLIAFYRERAQA
jgi:uncharacterized damage-inducible protein DinB